MCTAVSLKMDSHYFARNLDLHYSYNESVIITPRRHPLKFNWTGELKKHFAIMGTGILRDNTALYYDGINEKGLAVAALNFPDFAFYMNEKNGTHNVAPFEFIPRILAECENVRQVKRLLCNTNIVDLDFSSELPNTPLHWLVSDRHSSLVVEPCEDGLRVYDNDVGVLTNSPGFDMQRFNLNNYMHLSKQEPENTFSPSVKMKKYSSGMDALGLPGDMSSMSRFVRASFVSHNITRESEQEKSVGQMFRILSSVQMPKGCVRASEGDEEQFTVYSCCYNTEKGICYYKTYYDLCVRSVAMSNESLEGGELISYKMKP